jgi:hypothetical protein
MRLEDREEYKWAKFRWECIRRSPKLKNAMEKELKKHGITLGEYMTFEGLNQYALVSPELLSIRNGDFWSFDLSFDEIIRNIREKAPNIVGEYLATSLVTPKSVKFQLKKQVLNISINLDQVYSLAALKDFVAKSIQAYFKVAEMKMDVTPKERPKWRVLEVTLSVGDMKREGKTNHQIARKIFGKLEYSKNPASKERQVRTYYKNYCELMDELEHMQMLYP